MTVTGPYSRCAESYSCCSEGKRGINTEHFFGQGFNVIDDHVVLCAEYPGDVFVGIGVEADATGMDTVLLRLDHRMQVKQDLGLCQSGSL